MNFVDYNNVEICNRLYEKYQLCIQNKNLNNNIQCNIKVNKFFLKELGFKNINSLTDYKYNLKKVWYHLKLFFKIFINKLFLFKI